MSRTILITGGTGKIGSQLVKYFHDLGDSVLFTSRSQENISKLCLSCPGIKGIQVDFTSEDCVEIISTFLRERNLHVDCLVNNARDLSTLKVGELGHIERQHFLGELNIDVVVPAELSQRMIEEFGTKKIVNISSIYGMVSFNHHLYKGDKKFTLQYACAKAALIQLTKCMAVQYAEDGVQINAVSYGGVEGRVDNEFLSRYAKLCPAGRMLKDSETVGAVDFLLSDKSTYINGQNIVVDGGWTSW